MGVSKIRVWLMLPALVRSLLVFPWAFEAEAGIQGHQYGPSPLPSDEFPVAPHPTATCVCVYGCGGEESEEVRRCVCVCVCARVRVRVATASPCAASKQEAEGQT
ncbi:hypothetical protein CGRA01v4_01182 [Colletotrichum graminicola]|nr:hypothetical protein CGRA01v4_01182 [Colletotrichum graminicola]